MEVTAKPCWRHRSQHVRTCDLDPDRRRGRLLAQCHGSRFRGIELQDAGRAVGFISAVARFLQSANDENPIFLELLDGLSQFEASGKPLPLAKPPYLVFRSRLAEHKLEKLA